MRSINIYVINKSQSMYVLKTDNLKPADSDYLQLKIKE